jgi:hypothetical protein
LNQGNCYFTKPPIGLPTQPFGKEISKKEESVGAMSEIFTGS